MMPTFATLCWLQHIENGKYENGKYATFVASLEVRCAKGQRELEVRYANGQRDCRSVFAGAFKAFHTDAQLHICVVVAALVEHPTAGAGKCDPDKVGKGRIAKR